MSQQRSDEVKGIWAAQGSRVEILPGDADKAPEGRRPLAAREDRCWNLSPAIQTRLEAELAECLLPSALKITGREDPEALQSDLTKIIADFFPIYKNRPIQNNKGGGLINDSLCLYVSARLIAPEFILESGSYQGHSAWLLRQACPTARIMSCDIDHSQLLYRTDGVIYHEGDWTTLSLPDFDPATALVWFDCHIDHGRRLLEASERGFRQALFDDNFPVTNLYATGGIPVPTIDMILDDQLEDGCEVVWSRRGKSYRYRHDLSHAQAARAVILDSVKLPDLTQLTRYSPPSGMTYLRLRQG
ncbi:hypothetical protein ACTL6U_02635 [Rhodovibrionaceae bacterium A322]